MLAGKAFIVLHVTVTARVNVSTTVKLRLWTSADLFQVEREVFRQDDVCTVDREPGPAGRWQRHPESTDAKQHCYEDNENSTSCISHDYHPGRLRGSLC